MGNELTGDVWRIDLPSGGWVQIRSKMTVEDQRAVQGAVDVEIRSDGDGNSVARLPGDHALARRTALLARIITGLVVAGAGHPDPGEQPRRRGERSSR